MYAYKSIRNCFISYANNIVDVLNISAYKKYSTGKGVVIVVMDSGLPTHPDVNVNKKKSRNFVKGEDITDYYDHATPIAGILGAQYNLNNVEGICPDAELIFCKVLNRYGAGNNDAIKEALRYCLFIRPDIINCSFGAQDNWDSEIDELLQKCKEYNIFVVCASGNHYAHELDYPASSKYTISIGAIGDKNLKEDFSNYGNKLDFVMLGNDLYTTCKSRGYCSVTGTSFACPVFVGILALYLSYCKTHDIPWNYNNILQDFKKCNLDLGESGKDDLYGWGSVDLSCLFQKTPIVKVKPFPWYKRLYLYFKNKYR